MPSHFITVDGVELLINRVHRAAIDKFVAAHPEPEPPSRTVEIWGGIDEEIPDYNDPVYLSDIRAYRLLLGRDQLSMVYPALEIVKNKPTPDGQLLVVLQKRSLSDFELMKWVVLANAHDLEQIIEEFLYLSTVTPRGIEEAKRAYDVQWMDKEVTAWRTPALPARNSTLFRDRRAAQFCGYNWSSFCEMTGPQQSESVAFYMISQTLDYLSSKWRM